ncbi:unnamed protein product [Candida verbasci]|uniref:Major facilitator superfamily (MFS) profile domain-containing protein n=1 Tax=Candida verbasci TaxID=1227364 RepID=A0A9W4XE54_9ASCO|nr:unnamed protein product [Candida verbasci]
MRKFSTVTVEGDLWSVQFERRQSASVEPPQQQESVSTTTSPSISPQSSIDSQQPIETLMTANYPPKNKYRIISAVMFNFCAGFSDAAPGALLPYIEKSYNVNYAQASCIWISNAVGFISVASLSHKIQHWLGKRYIYPFGNLLSCVMYGIVSSGTYFPFIVIGFFFGGLGLAICSAQCNVFLSRLDKQSAYLSVYHGAYGLGATISPLIATSMVTKGIKWNYFYFIALGFMFATGVSFYFSFENADDDLKPWYDHPEVIIEMDSMNSNRNQAQVSSSQKSIMILALQNHITWLISFFCLFYQGSEVAVSGWITTFMLEYRNADRKLSGYFSSFFWIGLTLGRLLLTTPIHRFIGCRRGVFIISILSIILIGLTWAIKNTTIEAITVSLAGLFIGPNFPLLVTFSASRGLLPRKIQLVSLTIMTAYGSSGGALQPFIVWCFTAKIGYICRITCFFDYLFNYGYIMDVITKYRKAE